MTFSLPAQVTKVVLASLALQVIQVSLVSRVTRDLEAHRDARVSQANGGSQVFLNRALKEKGEKQDNQEKQVRHIHESRQASIICMKTCG